MELVGQHEEDEKVVHTYVQTPYVFEVAVQSMVMIWTLGGHAFNPSPNKAQLGSVVCVSVLGGVGKAT